MLESSLHEKLRLAGISCTLPSVSVSDALLPFVVSVSETAVRVTLGSAGSAAGPLKVDMAELAVVGGFIVPHAGEQFVPFCVSVQLNP